MFGDSIAVPIFQHNHPILRNAAWLDLRISHRAGNPETTGRVEVDLDGLGQQRIGGIEIDLKAIGNLKVSEFGRNRSIRNLVQVSLSEQTRNEREQNDRMQ